MALTLYWTVYPSATADYANNATDAAKVAAGQDSTGASLPAGQKGSQAYTTAGVIDASSAATGLSAGTSYKIAWTIFDGSTYGGGTATYVVMSAAFVTFTTHTTTGTLTADAAVVAGTASHLTLHTSTGALSAQAATVAGTAAHSTLHTSTGALAADAAVVAGTATHTAPGIHTTSGALAAQDAVVAGTAVHLTLHTATGALIAGSATLAGLAQNGTVVATPIAQGNLGWRVRKDKRDTDREELRQELMEALGEAVPDTPATQLLTPAKTLPLEVPAVLRAALVKVRRPHPEVPVQLKDLRAAVTAAQEAAQARQVRRKKQQAALLLY